MAYDSAKRRGLKVWFRDDIQDTLIALDTTNLEAMGTVDTTEMQLYRKGYAAAIRAVATAFGIPYRPVEVSLADESPVVDSPGWARSLH